MGDPGAIINRKFSLVGWHADVSDGRREHRSGGHAEIRPAAASSLAGYGPWCYHCGRMLFRSDGDLEVKYPSCWATNIFYGS